MSPAGCRRCAVCALFEPRDDYQVERLVDPCLRGGTPPPRAHEQRRASGSTVDMAHRNDGDDKISNVRFDELAGAASPGACRSLTMDATSHLVFPTPARQCVDMSCGDFVWEGSDGLSDPRTSATPIAVPMPWMTAPETAQDQQRTRCARHRAIGEQRERRSRPRCSRAS